MPYKQFSCTFFAIVGIFALWNIIFWHTTTKNVFYGHDGHGDLARMGSFAAAPAQTENICYAVSHREFRDYLSTGSQEQFDVLTVGDSASAGVGGTYYQDYLAERYGLQSINVIRTNRYDVWQQVNFLLHFGYLDRIRPKIVIVECGERELERHFVHPEKLPDMPKKAYEREYLDYQEKSSQSMVPTYALLTTPMGAANKKFVFDHLYARTHERALSPEVGIAALTIPAFSSPGQEHLLLYYREDLDYLAMPIDAEAVNANMNDLARKLAEKGAHLIFLVLPDKFDLYFPYLDDSRGYAENTFFEDIQVLPKAYTFINAKAPLREAAAQGVTDLYWGDDTHWSWKAQQIIGDLLMQQIRSLCGNIAPGTT